MYFTIPPGEFFLVLNVIIEVFHSISFHKMHSNKGKKTFLFYGLSKNTAIENLQHITLRIIVKKCGWGTQYCRLHKSRACGRCTYLYYDTVQE